MRKIKLFKRKEKRSEETTSSVSFEDALLRAIMGAGITVDKSQVLQIPAVQACIELIANIVSSLPVKLYEQTEDGTIEIKNDERVYLLNKDTKDTFTAVQFWKAIIEDYFLGKGAYAYINKSRGRFKSLHYVEEQRVSPIKNNDSIFKNYNIYVDGDCYYPYQFFKVLRKTRNGADCKSLITENNLIFSVGYMMLNFENNLLKKGGNKKGFLKSENKLDDPAMTVLKEAWRNLYSNNSENVMILNKGLDFQESSNTSVEMQLNETKITNITEIAMLFNVPPNMIRGEAKTATEDEKNLIKHCIIPLLNNIENSLDRDFLLEKEKEKRYYAFDTKELTRGSLKERYEAYQIGIKSHFLQPDEIRDIEDMKPLGIDFIELGLDTVMYNPKTKEIYTPNTNATQKLDELNKTDDLNKTDNLKGGEEIEN